MANDLMKLILDQPADVLASVDYWEPMNEPDPPGDVGYSQLGKLAIECMGIADRYGIKLAILSLNCGTPEWSEMQTLANTGVFEIAKNGGHILALHEGVFENQPIDHWWPDPIPDAPQVAGAGALCFRYRYLYSILRERGEIVPLVISEFRMNGASYPLGIEELVERFKWYDERARTDWYVLGVCPFTIGATGSQWFPSHDYGLAYPSLIDYAVSVENGKDTDEPECDCFGLPREQYERTVLLLPPDGDSRTLSRIVLAFFDAFGFTVTRSADDAGVGALDEKNVIAISPLGWPGDLREFYEQYYPGTNYIPVKYDNLYQLDGRVLAGILKARGLRLRFPLNRSRYVTSEFGVYRTPADSSPYYHNGTDYRGGHNDRILAAHDGVVVYAGYDQSEPWFGHQIKTRASLPDGVEIQIRYAHLPASGGIFVSPGDVVSAGQQIGIPDNTGNSTGSHLHIDVKCLGYYADPEMLVVQEQTPTPNVKVAIGMHDDGGASWMNSNGLTGYALCHRQIRENVEPVDFSSMDRLGIKVIMRWGYGYADGSGTVPPSNIADSWAVTCAESIILSRGVYCNTMFNEWNNVGEWPGGYPKPTEIVSPGHVLYLYNKVVGLLPENIKIAPGAIDPYNVVAGEFGEPADPMYWFEHIMAGAVRADAIMIHAKTQTSDPSECSSNELFSNPPLQERFLHLRAYRNVLSWVPERWRHLPVFISELNPQRKYDGSLGWEDEPAWVNAAMEELRAFNEIAEQPITGVMFYRYDVTGGDQKEFGVSAKPNVLAEIKRQFE
jgi:murein DD-endopeptidase MepM/ murein hydrolase activator NlpD